MLYTESIVQFKFTKGTTMLTVNVIQHFSQEAAPVDPEALPHIKVGRGKAVHIADATRVAQHNDEFIPTACGAGNGIKRSSQTLTDEPVTCKACLAHLQGLLEQAEQIESENQPEAPKKTTVMDLYEIPGLKHNPCELLKVAEPRSLRTHDEIVEAMRNPEWDFRDCRVRIARKEDKLSERDLEDAQVQYRTDLENARRTGLTHLDSTFGVRVDDLKGLLKDAKKLLTKKRERKGVGMWSAEEYDILFQSVTLEVRGNRLAAYVYVVQPDTNEIARQYVPYRITVSNSGVNLDMPVALDALIGTRKSPGNLDFEDAGTALMLRHEYTTGDLHYRSGNYRVRIARARIASRHYSRYLELSAQCYDQQRLG